MLIIFVKDFEISKFLVGGVLTLHAGQLQPLHNIASSLKPLQPIALPSAKLYYTLYSVCRYIPPLLQKPHHCSVLGSRLQNQSNPIRQ